MVNRVCLVGNCTRDAEVRQTQSGMTVMNVGVAVNNRRKDSQTGEWVDDPCFVDCTMFGQRAQKISQYLQKGTKVAIDGKLRYSSWERDGVRRTKLEVIIDDLDFMSARPQGYNDQGQDSYPGVSPQVAYAAQQAKAASGYDDESYGVFDEDIPF